MRKKSGQDVVSIPWENGTYTGEVVDGVPHGQGIETYTDGTKYVGEWKNGKYNGRGTYTYADGVKFVGKFKNGVEYGDGILTSEDAVDSFYPVRLFNYLKHIHCNRVILS